VKSLRPTLRRLSVYAAASIAATVGVVALAASPASAHHPVIVGDAVCDQPTGNWVVTWTVSNSETQWAAKITALESTPAPAVTGAIAVNAIIPKKGEGSLTGTQTLPSSATSATLKITAFWDKPHPKKDETDSKEATVEFKGTCVPNPDASFEDECDGSVIVTLTNGPNATADAQFVVTGPGGFSESRSVEPGDSTTVPVPASAAGAIVVTVGGKVVEEYAWKNPGDCPTTPPPTTEPPATNPPTTTAPPGLPDTGVQLTTLVGVGVALIGVGAGLLFVLRRRRAGEAV
jgi:LPXTG-motif cell wall-anchored protein